MPSAANRQASKAAGTILNPFFQPQGALQIWPSQFLQSARRGVCWIQEQARD